MKIHGQEGKELQNENVPEKRKHTVIATAVIVEPIIRCEKYSSFYKLVRIVAYILRFSYNARCDTKERKIGPVSTTEIDEAKRLIIKIVQLEEFEDDIKAIKREGSVLRKSRLITFNPFLDEQGILRVGGRLKHAELQETFKHPIILPATHHFTLLVIKHYHEMLYHSGTQATLNAIREEFWPIFAKSQVKKIVRKCVKCRKANPTPSRQIMGQLPSVRVNAARPFLNTGVDYCGPFYVRDRVRRNSKQYKSYVAIFVCMATKALHIELVEDLSTETFISALKRFMSRRGKVQNLYSDNGRNFVGADHELQKLFKSEEFKRNVLESATAERIVWHFISARSPHFDGLWESAVRSMKLHLKRTIGNASLTVIEMITVLAQVETILNSRPLTPLSDDPMDLKALTPGNFLIGENLMAYPEPDLQEVALNRLSRWQHVEQIKQHFWTRWQKEYLSTCQQRSKWKTDTHTKL